MICPPCRQAADRLTASLNWLAGQNHSALAYPPLYEAAREAHAECLGPTSCDCQHKVERHGVGIQR
jgi:hypothetical protein